ncbi:MULTISPECIES: MarR family winged helix-turn-helix transcriptional regulator [unclassified Curtobacterium]|uniref:MarR family winged helix-turn-helix transcriptional regulator n=1 Tax=unclassified Curtobacterium TaxID=257496 RepID=UPI001495EF7B|nr:MULTISPECIES: MarR family winged helix-turn-helix transcriptional regulator [unclassified Curtobacterium]WIA96509.1 MarR family winged helix-turn-helix transcriptional regulator [Curtobacterium sp. MCBA15_004]WIA99816.1 MarR family winged helix-turn-helix transcriptional regulator [Curtobacterium sp. MCBA15_012]
MSSDGSVTPDDIDAIAAWTVVRAARELARRLGEDLAHLDLTPVEFGALVQLAAADHLSQADLARAVGIRPQSTATLVAALGTRGLVERGAAPGRGRASRLHLTPAGRELLAAAWPIAQASNAWFPDGGTAVAAALRPFTSGNATAEGADGVA